MDLDGVKSKKFGSQNKANKPNFNFDEILSNKEKYALEYCEGNADLYKLLIKLWDNNIETVGCCSGHDLKKAYVGISLEKNIDIILKILSSVKKDDILISFTSNGICRNVSIKNTNHSREHNFFIDVINALDENDISKEIADIIDYILNFKDGYINIRLFYKNNKQNMFLATNNLELIEKLKNDYEFVILNEKINMYYFSIKKGY